VLYHPGLLQRDWQEAPAAEWRRALASSEVQSRAEPSRRVISGASLGNRHLALAGGTATVAILIAAVVALLELQRNVAVATVGAQHAAGGALTVAAIVCTIIALLELRLHDCITTVRSYLTSRRATAVGTVVHAVVALLPELVLEHGIPATRPWCALGRALVVLAGVATGPVITELARANLAISAVCQTVAGTRVEPRESQLIGGARHLALGLEDLDLVDITRLSRWTWSVV
jgi:hypothetical protein